MVDRGNVRSRRAPGPRASVRPGGVVRWVGSDGVARGAPASAGGQERLDGCRAVQGEVAQGRRGPTADDAGSAPARCCCRSRGWPAPSRCVPGRRPPQGSCRGTLQGADLPAGQRHPPASPLGHVAQAPTSKPGEAQVVMAIHQRVPLDSLVRSRNAHHYLVERKACQGSPHSPGAGSMTAAYRLIHELPVPVSMGLPGIAQGNRLYFF